MLLRATQTVQAMANDPQALSANLTGSPNEADYDAVYAALSSTERGRWFLTEFASRNRHADTGRLVAAIARIEAAIHSDPPQDPGSDLFEIVAAIALIEAEIGTDAEPETGALAAVERIRDIAFVLHERSVEATICDALDAAIREISDVCGRSGTAAARLRRAAGRLRLVANRLSAMIASSSADPPAHPPVADGTAGQSNERAAGATIEHEGPLASLLDYAESPDATLFELDDDQADNLSRAIGKLVASLPSLAAARDAPFDPQPAPSEPRQSSPSAASDVTSSEMVFGNEPSRQDLPTDGTTHERALSTMSGLLTDPQEDPADLFESDAGIRTNVAEQLAPIPNSAETESLPHPSEPSRAAATTAAAATHSIAAMRALSDEELIALFS